MSEQEIIKHLKSQVVLPLFYDSDEQVCIEIVKTLYASGIRIIEFTNRGENALANFEKLATLRNSTMPDLMLAVGTIHTAQQAQQFIQVGANFLISPFFDEEVATYTKQNNILWLPGCLTPSEINKAIKHGCKVIKLFPGNIVGASYVSTIKELFTNVAIVVTGGVGLSQIELQEWMHAGADGLGFGSKLITKQVLQNKLYEKLQVDTIVLLNNVQSILKNK